MSTGFSQRLRELRRQKNLSQMELAKLVGIHPSHIGRYERGESARPAADTLKRLADVFGVTSDYLLEGAADDLARTQIDDRELLHQFQEVEQLPDEEKIVIKKLIEAFLTKKKLQKLAAQ